MQATIQKLTDRLLEFVDEEKNVSDMAGVVDVISSLEKLHIPREVLEVTRLGLVVNEIRKRNAQTYPELTQRCKNLIKIWQQVAKGSQADSLSSSRSGTPTTPYFCRSGISPAVMARLTPKGSLGGKKPISPLVTGGGLSEIRSRSMTPLTAVKSVPLRTHTTPSPLPSGAKSEEKREGGGFLSDSYAPTTSESASSASSNAGIKLKIKIGGSEGSGSTTTVIRTISSPNLCLVDKESAENRRKRKLEDRDGQDFADSGYIACNGAASRVSPPEIAEQQPRRKRGRPRKNPEEQSPNLNRVLLNNLPSSSSSCSISASAAGSGATTPIVAQVPGRPPKLKSTLEYLKDVNKSLPDDMAISLDVDRRGSGEPAGGLPGLAGEPVWVSNKSEEEEEEMADVKGKKRGRKKREWKVQVVEKVDRKRKKTEDLRQVKTELVQKFLDSSSREADDSGAAGSLAKSQNFLSSPALMELSGEKGNSTPAPEVEKSIPHLPETSGKKEAKARNWYDILPPLDGELLGQIKSASAKSLLDQDEDEGNLEKTGIKIEDSEFASTSKTGNSERTKWPIPENWKSCEQNFRKRFLKKEKNREVLGMPYVDIGIPDFLEYKFPESERFLSHLNFLFKPDPTQNKSAENSSRSSTATPMSSVNSSVPKLKT